MDLSTTPTYILITYLTMKTNDQEFTNICALELAKRIWVPNKEETFEEMLYKFGYRDIQEKTKHL